MSCQQGMPRGQAEFVAAYPAVAQVVDDLCAARPWCLTGLSALLHDDEGLWFELTKPKHWQERPDGVTVVGLGAIGGSLEPGESLLGCLQRECLEEIGQLPVIESTAETVIVYEERALALVAAEPGGQPAPALLTVSANLYSQHRLPQCEILAIVTFWGRLSEAPRLGDLYGLLRLSRDSLAIALQQPALPLEMLLALPGTMLQHNAPLPGRAVVRPVWTVRSLQLALRDGALSPGDWG